MRKVTMQDIADALGVSRVTVWKVFNNQPGVSEFLKSEVLAKANELGYNKGIAELPAAKESKNISIVVSRPESSFFWTSIIHSMAEELSQNSINLIYTCVDPIYTDSFQLPRTLVNGSFNAVVIMNIYDAQIIRRLNSIPIPKVFLDTVPDVTFGDVDGDLILIEGYHTIYKITESVIKRGVKDIGFIGDIMYAQTNHDRYAGFLTCMKDNNLPVNQKYCKTDKIDIYSYKQELFNYLDSLETLPSAFICVSDYIAHFVQFYLAEHPGAAPNGIIITGFDANDEYTNVDGIITTADVCVEKLGKRLARQCIYRMTYSDSPYELTYISPKIIYRDSKF
ncbi:MAG: LacI family transcriptional regulator [Butyrivibrio sp.]|uniref:LacI family DNA-binding transcriptional regulator n=1 Tax=Butyrivibrio sp. NC2002 TaxID=1410610 RepID=UPI0005672576|nr:LacI family DNA-binding transcriptional regulator [Butyrivibrio sp. NC2002]MBE5860302.1 LacI family transcriptional regulator [Butyrivibrio sp.]